MSVPAIIDTDAHIIEAADLWTSRLPEKWGDQRMHVRWDEKNNVEVWAVGDRALRPAWSSADYGWREGEAHDMLESWETAPPTLADCHPATYDPKERAKAMDSWGIRAAVLYPNIGGVGLGRLGWDPKIATAHVKAYNDFQLEWVAAAPGRFVPMAVIPFWDVRESLAEIERASGLGFGGIVSTGAPHLHDQPCLADPHWDPIWSAAVGADFSISFHIGNAKGAGSITSEDTSYRARVEGGAAFYARAAVSQLLDNGHQLTDLLCSGVLARHPQLKVVSVESGIGWIPFVLEACDYHFKKALVWKQRPEFGDMLPSDLFRRQVYANYWFERLEDWHLEALTVDHILFETDFPHPTCLTGEDLKAALHRGLDVLPSEVQDKILSDNASALYGLAPSPTPVGESG